MKEIIKKIISYDGKEQSITQEEFNEFINETFYLFRNKYPSVEEFNKIISGFKIGLFNIESTIDNITTNSNKFGFSVESLYNKNKQLIKRYVI